jgi:hypothetical protein
MSLGPGREWERIAKEISEAFGLKHANRMVITLEAGKIPRIEVWFIPETDELESAASFIKTFRLVPMEGTDKDKPNA